MSTRFAPSLQQMPRRTQWSAGCAEHLTLDGTFVNDRDSGDEVALVDSEGPVAEQSSRSVAGFVEGSEAQGA
jgi:hypothetical protein